MTTVSTALQSAVVAAADAHLASVTTEVNAVKSAVSADIPSVTATASSIEALVKAEVAKLKTDVGAVWKPWMTYVVVAGVAVGGTFAVHLAHLF